MEGEESQPARSWPLWEGHRIEGGAPLVYRIVAGNVTDAEPAGPCHSRARRHVPAI